MMCFHRISPCPACGGKVKTRWENRRETGDLFDQFAFRCAQCPMGFAFAYIGRKPKGNWTQFATRCWNAMCNGDKRYRWIYESLGGRR